ncbi:2Fe-2S iron-sulfur cluster binding domain-containing protein [Pseudomonas sp. P115]|uniref:2Fe-2S iron-sulfur cluster-binding protein n=1 Tax=Pseudomonas pisciculturae TaxID=2730413 RepID=UPI00189229B6|nr:2Fe-2S iron-sulfur cluster-binding protein [Pseudomonas pisciculturae]MBF6029793.1 2Fe-2S iron-sulfur cluster binding domain-containing protein [Pseudomonas pisciculturae]
MEILVQPLNRQINVVAGSNLLDALLSHAIPISYSCMSGRCGTCRCKVLHGSVVHVDATAGQPPQHGDYFLACQCTVQTDCVIEVPEPDEVVMHPARTLKGTVTAFEALAHDVRRLRLKLNKPLEFSPGQYVTLQFWPEAVRSYSMAGLCGDDELEFHVRIVPDGRVTALLDERLALGAAIKVNGPMGASYLRRKHLGPMLCIAGGTGLAPMLSVIRGALKSGMPNDIHLYFGVRAERDVYGVSMLEALARDFPRFHYHIVLSSPGPDQPSAYLTGWVTDVVAEHFPRLDGWKVYLAGPPPMVEAANTLVSQLGVPFEHIHADAFYASGA